MASTDSREQLLDSLPMEVSLLRRLESLKELERQNPLGCASRKEKVAEHSWHIGIGVIVLAQYCPADVDIARAVLLATVHDVVEAFVGDTFAFGDDVAGQQSREQSAVAEIRSKFPGQGANLLADLWEEYESQITPEAKFVKGVDAFLPILLNFVNSENSSWRQHSVSASKVTTRLERVAASLGPLADLNRRMISQAVAEGHLADG
ncbi:HD family hydrolase [Micromonospora sp. NPDC051227]|uniref:HD domain-containing protein n=1 Tax=Micromonospora sp. NPDC051227 TaxID=3364285 RepID=UPI0019328251|nr:HD domain-containing protein [Micromonospora sp. STR1s_5]